MTTPPGRQPLVRNPQAIRGGILLHKEFSWPLAAGALLALALHQSHGLSRVGAESHGPTAPLRGAGWLSEGVPMEPLPGGSAERVERVERSE